MTAKPSRRRIRHVLCAVDFSDCSRTALRHAAAIAGRMNAQLTVLFADDPLLTTAAAAAAYDAAWLEKKTVSELRRFIARAGVTRAHRLDVVSGHPAAAIIREVERLKADLVVIGTHGLRGPGKWFYGSTAERTLRTTRVPVLVVPSGAARTSRALSTWPGRRAVVPIDFDDCRTGDVANALAWVSLFGASPLLVHVVTPAAFPAWLTIDARADERRRLDTAQRGLRRLAKALGDDVDCQFAFGDPVQEIAASAAGSRAGLIVIPLRRGWSLAGPRRGAVSYGLVCRGGVPVLALPERRG